jgi:hypothetical protein
MPGVCTVSTVTAKRPRLATLDDNGSRLFAFSGCNQRDAASSTNLG